MLTLPLKTFQKTFSFWPQHITLLPISYYFTKMDSMHTSPHTVPEGCASTRTLGVSTTLDYQSRTPSVSILPPSQDVDPLLLLTTLTRSKASQFKYTSMFELMYPSNH